MGLPKPFDAITKREEGLQEQQQHLAKQLKKNKMEQNIRSGISLHSGDGLHCLQLNTTSHSEVEEENGLILTNIAHPPRNTKYIEDKRRNWVVDSHRDRGSIILFVCPDTEVLPYEGILGISKRRRCNMKQM